MKNVHVHPIVRARLPMRLFHLWLLIAASMTLPFSTALSQTKDLMFLETSSGKRRPIKNKEDWEQRRRLVLLGMQEAMGSFPGGNDEPPSLIVKDSLKRNGYTRLTVTLLAAPNEPVPAYLYIPLGASPAQKLPAMLVLHGTGEAGKQLVDGKSKLPNRAHARELAERGYVVIAPDYPSMGELTDYNFETDRYQSGTMKALFNHMRCVDLLQTLPCVDPDRIGVIGHSLGGHNAMFAGAFDERLKVIVSSCGWTLMSHYSIGEEGAKRYGGRLGPWAQERYMPLLRERFQLDDKLFPFDFDEVIAALAPRPFFSNSPRQDGNFDVEGVRLGIESAKRIYRLLDAEENLQVRYPVAGHDFPKEVRLEAYRFIDDVLRHTPAIDVPE